MRRHAGRREADRSTSADRIAPRDDPRTTRCAMCCTDTDSPGPQCFLGVDGTKRGQRQRARFFSRNVGVPVMIIAIGTGAQVAAALPELEATAARTASDASSAHSCANATANCSARPDRAARRRRPRTPAVAEADGLHVGGHTARRRADPPRDRPAAARLTCRQRRDRAARAYGDFTATTNRTATR